MRLRLRVFLIGQTRVRPGQLRGMRRYVETRGPKRIDAALTQRGQVVPPGRDELRFTLPYFFVDHDAGADVSPITKLSWLFSLLC